MTLQYRRIATTVLKQYSLLMVFNSRLHLLNQSGRERCFHQFFASQFLDILHHDFGQCYIAIARQHLHQTEFTRHGVVIRLHRRCSRSKQHLGPHKLCQHDGCITSLVPRRRVLLFITRFMFFVNNHKPQILKRQKNRRTDAQYQRQCVLRQLSFP